MKFSMNKKLAAGAAGLLVLGGGAGALAATQLSSSNPRQAYFDDVANRLHVTPAQLSDAMKQATLDRVNAALAAGKITQAQADAIKSRIAQSGALFIGPGFGGRFGMVRPGFGLRAGGQVVAGYLGISTATLRQDLASGKTLAQIASTTPGKSVSGLESAITTAAKAKLDKAVANQRITAAQESQMLSKLSQALPTLVNRSLPAGVGPRFGFRHP
jgi:hypothetical protein